MKLSVLFFHCQYVGFFHGISPPLCNKMNNVILTQLHDKIYQFKNEVNYFGSFTTS